MMAVDTAPTRIAALRRSTGLRGRPLTVEPVDFDEARIEVAALRREMRQAGTVIPLAKYVRQVIAFEGAGPAVDAQSRVIDFLEAMGRRGGDAA